MMDIRTYISAADEVSSNLLDGVTLPWDLIAGLKKWLEILLDGRRSIDGLVMPGALVYGGPLKIEKGAVIEPGACIIGPAYIGRNVTVRSGAYVRGNCVFLEGAMLGHASEAKNSVFFPGAKAPHFAYVGDSILGHHVNLGAGTKLSNVKTVGSQTSVTIPLPTGMRMDTGLRKFGAVLGDYVSIGCNTVLNPGTVLGRGTLVYPGTVLGPGCYPSESIVKSRQQIEVVPRLRQ